jgi:polyhydroxyalkanoate synthase
LIDYSHDMMGVALDRIRRHSGSRDLSLMGWCMGGLLCLLYQGLVKDTHVRNIVTVASPIDLETGVGVISAVAGVAQAMDGPAQLVSNYSNLRLNTLDPARLSLPPWMTTLVFKMTDPVGSVTTYLDLVTRLGDREFVESHSTTSDYLNNMLRYPGGVFKDMSGSVVTDNQLAKGRVVIGDHVAELDKIESSLLAFAGEGDILVPPEVAAKSVDVVASKDTDFRVAPGGHMGVIIGSKAQNAVWKDSAEWLASRSAATPKKKKSRARGKTGVSASSKKTKASARGKNKARAS